MTPRGSDRMIPPNDVIVTGASRGIGRALALELASESSARLLLVARDADRLGSLVTAVRAKGGWALAVPGDLSILAGARALGQRLADVVAPGSTLVHNAGLWPTTRTLTPDGLETSFVVNHLGPLLLQQPLVEAKRLRRMMVVSAGLVERGSFDPDRTPTGRDFSPLRTYCTTKLCFAVATREIAAANPWLDVVVLHPGVVRTDLGVGPGILGWLVSRLKRSFEAPETCATRLGRVLARERWSQPGLATWLFEEEERPWPPAADNERTSLAVRQTTAALLHGWTAGAAS